MTCTGRNHARTLGDHAAPDLGYYAGLPTGPWVPPQEAPRLRRADAETGSAEVYFFCSLVHFYASFKCVPYLRVTICFA